MRRANWTQLVSSNERLQGEADAPVLAQALATWRERWPGSRPAQPLRQRALTQPSTMKTQPSGRSCPWSPLCEASRASRWPSVLTPVALVESLTHSYGWEGGWQS